MKTFQISYIGPTTSCYHDAVSGFAQLTDPDGGAPIADADRTMAFGLGIGDTSSATTDSASCQITPHQAGVQSLNAAFGPDTDYLSANTVIKTGSTIPGNTVGIIVVDGQVRPRDSGHQPRPGVEARFPRAATRLRRQGLPVRLARRGAGRSA